MNKEYKLPMAAFEFVFFIKKKSQNSVFFLSEAEGDLVAYFYDGDR